MDPITNLKLQIAGLSNRIQQDQVRLHHCYWQLRLLQDEQVRAAQQPALDMTMYPMPQPPPPKPQTQPQTQPQQVLNKSGEWPDLKGQSPTKKDDIQGQCPTKDDLQVPPAANPSLSPRLELPKNNFPTGNLLLETTQQIVKMFNSAETKAFKLAQNSLPHQLISKSKNSHHVITDPSYVRYPVYLNNVKTEESMKSDPDQVREGQTKEVWDRVLDVLRDRHPDSYVRIEKMYKKNHSNFENKTLTFQVYVELNEQERTRIKKKISLLRNSN